jgi:sulfatase maturation enzyme AslB (radical SAM superfamily)
MDVQSLSIAVPLTGCVNKCPFCVSRMHGNDYRNRFSEYTLNRAIESGFVDRLRFAKQNGCHTVILTGTGEPLQNKAFMGMWTQIQRHLGADAFQWVELQTTGVLIEPEYIRSDHFTMRYLALMGIKTISLSVSDLFDVENNKKLIRMPAKIAVDFTDICQSTVENDLNLRLCMNLTEAFDSHDPEEAFSIAKKLGANQVTVRKLYRSNEDAEVDRWVKDHAASEETVKSYYDYILKNGNPLERLPFGAVRYSINGMSTVLDENCMPQGLTESFRYLILRPDCKLYSRWDDKGSVLF